MDILFLAITGATGAIATAAVKKYKKKILKAQMGRMKRHLKKYIRKYNTAKFVEKSIKFMPTVDALFILVGSSVGELILAGIDRYIDPKLGYKKNNLYIFG